MTNKTKFRLENLAIEGRVETPKINGIYVNKEIAKYWEKDYGDNTFCLINLKPLFDRLRRKKNKEENSPNCSPYDNFLVGEDVCAEEDQEDDSSCDGMCLCNCYDSPSKKGLGKTTK
jgi:hypothetical protein